MSISVAFTPEDTKLRPDPRRPHMRNFVRPVAAALGIAAALSVAATTRVAQAKQQQMAPPAKQQAAPPLQAEQPARSSRSR